MISSLSENILKLCHDSFTQQLLSYVIMSAVLGSHTGISAHTHTHTRAREEYSNKRVWYESEQDFNLLIHSASSTYPPISSLFTCSGCCYSGFSICFCCVCLSHSFSVCLFSFFMSLLFVRLPCTSSSQFICIKKHCQSTFSKPIKEQFRHLNHL